MAQANRLKQLLSPTVDLEIVPIRTSGDAGNREQLGAFVHEIQLALLDNRVDLALHCLKDLPTRRIPGLEFAAFLPREDARDTIITRDSFRSGAAWAELGAHSVVGTGSVRRTSQLGARRPDLQFKALVGNVDTRLNKLKSGEYDAIVLAIAGLKRLGLLETWHDGPYGDLKVEPLEYTEMLPAPGQGILVIEARESDRTAFEAVRALHDEPSSMAARAERAFLESFGCGCSVPVAALATVTNGGIELEGLVASPTGSVVLRESRGGSHGNPERIGVLLAEELKARGALELFHAEARV